METWCRSSSSLTLESSQLTAGSNQCMLVLRRTSLMRISTVCSTALIPLTLLLASESLWDTMNWLVTSWILCTLTLASKNRVLPTHRQYNTPSQQGKMETLPFRRLCSLTLTVLDHSHRTSFPLSHSAGSSSPIPPHCRPSHCTNKNKNTKHKTQFTNNSPVTSMKDQYTSIPKLTLVHLLATGCSLATHSLSWLQVCRQSTPSRPKVWMRWIADDIQDTYCPSHARNGKTQTAQRFQKCASQSANVIQADTEILLWSMMCP
jgi:hypothetical protein